MNSGRTRRGVALALSVALGLGIGASTIAPAQAAAKTATTTITWLTTNDAQGLGKARVIVALFQAKNPNIKVQIVGRPGGTDGDNLIKTKLATGTMESVFNYNSGALLQALNPGKTLVDLTKLPFQKNVYDSFKASVTVGNKVVGAPYGTATGYGIYYNVADFEKAGITSTPKTWDELIADGSKLKAAGITPMCATFGDSWSAQLLVLSDFYNVHAVYPNMVTDYNKNKAHYATTPSMLAGWQHLEQVQKLGFLNSDANTAKYTDAITRISSGACAMYPMGTWLTSGIAATDLQKVGFMAQPGSNAKNVGLTTGMPNAVYIPTSTKGAKLVAAEKFVSFLASKAGTDAYVAYNGYDGPFVTKDQTAAPAGIPLATANLAALVKSGKTYPALEFLSPIKGPNMPGITVQVGSGQISAQQGAALYDQDVVAQAQQLGLAGW